MEDCWRGSGLKKPERKKTEGKENEKKTGCEKKLRWKKT